MRTLASSVIVLCLAAACANDRTVPFSERPELREETVPGCGGGGLRYLVPARASEALREAATTELLDEPAHYLESVRVPCEMCDERGGVCGLAVARYRSEPGSGARARAGVLLRFRATVASAERANAWRLLDSHRLVDDARIEGVMTLDAAARVLDWTRTRLVLERPVYSIAGRDALTESDAPETATVRIAELIRAEPGSILYRRIYLRAVGDGYEVLGETRHEETMGSARESQAPE